MDREEIVSILHRAMAEEFELEPERLTPDARIRDDLGLDSLDIIDLVVVLETAFAFNIPDKSALLKIATFGDVVDFIDTTAQRARKDHEPCG